MAQAEISAELTAAPSSQSRRLDTLFRVLKYTVVRAVTLFITVMIGVYLSIFIANMGGYVDEIQKSVIREQAALIVLGVPELRDLPLEERNRVVEERIRLEEDRLGLNQPFLQKSFRYLYNAMTLQLGRSLNINSASGSKQVRLILTERLPATLFLFATSFLILFFAAIFVALYLSRRYGTFLDKLIVTLAPTSAAPSWFYGIFFILIFAAILKILPFGGMVEAPPPPTKLAYAGSLLKHLILPTSAIVVSAIFQSIYAWRTFFLIYSSEDYVELAHAKGLSSRAVERRYILRPTMPTIVTSFALTLIGLWTGGILLETVFAWPGLGRLLFQAIGLYDTPVIIGSTVIYGYLLSITVFILDIVYVLIDPRVKVGLEGGRS